MTFGPRWLTPERRGFMSFDHELDSRDKVPMVDADLPEIPAELEISIDAFLEASLRHILQHESADAYFAALDEITRRSGVPNGSIRRCPSGQLRAPSGTTRRCPRGGSGRTRFPRRNATTLAPAARARSSSAAASRCSRNSPWASTTSCRYCGSR